MVDTRLDRLSTSGDSPEAFDNSFDSTSVEVALIMIELCPAVISDIRLQDFDNKCDDGEDFLKYGFIN